MKTKHCNDTKYIEIRIDTVEKYVFFTFWFQLVAMLQTVLRGGIQRSGFVASFVYA